MRALEELKQYCSKVYSVNRFIEPTSAVARAALEELFKGPTVSEKKIGYLNNLNSGVKIHRQCVDKAAELNLELQVD